MSAPPCTGEACATERFCVIAIETIHDAIEVLTGMPAGQQDEQGACPEGTLLRLAVERSDAFWQGLSSAGLVLRGGRPAGRRPGSVPVVG